MRGGMDLKRAYVQQGGLQKTNQEISYANINRECWKKR
jgi:hypothetical protein